MNWQSTAQVWDELDSPCILVVDDDPAMLRMIRLTLVSEGFHVETASDGVAGLERLSQQRFDLVVLDLQMPVMDGRTMYVESRKRGDATPMLVLSAYGADEACAELKAAGAVSKPFDTAVLTARIRSILQA